MITIYIPFFNAESYLEKAILSVLSQTYQDFKLVLINDGSTDESLRIANNFLSDSRITVISSDTNRNLIYWLNETAKSANTQFLTRMDADDIMHPQKIEKQMQVLLANPYIDVLGTNAYVINKDDEVVGVRYPYDSRAKRIIKCTTFINPTVIGRTEWFQKNLFDENAVRLEDLELWRRTAERSNFFYLSEPLFFYREVADENYHKKYTKALPTFHKILKKYHYDRFWVKEYLKYLIMPLIFKGLSFFNKGDLLFKRRNHVNFTKVKTIEEIIRKAENVDV